VCSGNPRTEDDVHWSIQNDVLCHDCIIFNNVILNVIIVWYLTKRDRTWLITNSFKNPPPFVALLCWKHSLFPQTCRVCVPHAYKCSSLVAVLADSAGVPFCFASRTEDFFKTSPIQHQLRVVFPHLARLVIVLFLFKMVPDWKLYLICKCCVWNRRIRIRVSEFTLSRLVLSVFSVYVVHKLRIWHG